MRSKRAFEELGAALSEEDFKAMLESSREFTERFALR